MAVSSKHNKRVLVVRDGSRKRPGVILSMELVLVLPIFLLLVFSLIEFSMLISGYTRVACATHCGARLLSISGATTAEVEQQVTSLLGATLSSGCRVSVISAIHAGQAGSVNVQVPMKNASPDLLWLVGFGLQDRTFDCTASGIMERPKIHQHSIASSRP